MTLLIEVNKFNIVEVCEPENDNHRYCIAPGEDYSTHPAEVQAACAEAHTQEVIAAYVAMTTPPPRFATVAEALAGIKADIAAERYRRETAGITLNGLTVRTDRESQALITGAWCRAQQNPNVLIDWKGENGWMQIDAATINAVSAAVGDHVQACFSAEKAHIAALEATAAQQGATVATVEAYDYSTGWPV